jgi:hypothetical protein
LVVIYSCGPLAPDDKRKISTLAADRYFDLSVLQLPAEEDSAVRKLLSLLHPLRAMADERNQDKTH